MVAFNSVILGYLLINSYLFDEIYYVNDYVLY